MIEHRWLGFVFLAQFLTLLALRVEHTGDAIIFILAVISLILTLAGWAKLERWP